MGCLIIIIMKAIVFLISIILALNSAQAKNDRAQIYYLVDQPLDRQHTQLDAIEANQEAVPVNVVNW